jgi:hypothetical protein
VLKHNRSKAPPKGTKEEIEVAQKELDEALLQITCSGIDGVNEDWYVPLKGVFTAFPKNAHRVRIKSSGPTLNIRLVIFPK